MNLISRRIILFFLFLISAQLFASKADSLISLANKQKDPGKKIQLLIQASAYLEMTDVGKAIRLAEQAEKIAVDNEDQVSLCDILLMKAKIYYVLSDLQNAMACAVKAKDIATQYDLQKNLAVAMDAIGFVYYELGDANKSSDYFFASLRIYEKLKDKTGVGKTYCRIGTLYYKQKENVNAIDYFQRSIAIARDLKNNEGIASNLNNVAMVYSSENKFEKALPLYVEALEINRQSGNLQLQGSNYHNLAGLYLKMGKYDSAMANVNRALLIFKQIGNTVRYSTAKVTQGDIFLAMGKPDAALDAANEAFTESTDHGFKESVMEASALLHRLYLEKKDTSMAYRYFLINMAMKDSIASGENRKNLAKLEMQYQFEKREQELTMEKERKNFWIVILSLIIVFGFVLFLVLRSRYKLQTRKAELEKKSLKKDLDYKKRELATNVMGLMKKNEMLSDITQKIIRIKKEAQQEETKAALKKIINELQKSTEEEILKEFSLRFREVHTDFYDNLLKKYPALTPSELKLCAFLRLNMTTKEIAELTGQQISTLENARYRLRQKLGISSTETNLVTFLAQV